MIEKFNKELFSSYDTINAFITYNNYTHYSNKDVFLFLIRYC